MKVNSKADQKSDSMKEDRSEILLEIKSGADS